MGPAFTVRPSTGHVTERRWGELHANPDATWNRVPGGEGRWRRSVPRCPCGRADSGRLRVILGCVWSYQEQTRSPRPRLHHPDLLPLVIDGFAVPWRGGLGRSLEARRRSRPGGHPVAVAASSASNGVWAYLRADHDMVTVVLGVTVPIAANLGSRCCSRATPPGARRRGLPPPVAVPYPHDPIVWRRGKPSVLALAGPGDHRNGSRGSRSTRCMLRSGAPGRRHGKGPRPASPPSQAAPSDESGGPLWPPCPAGGHPADRPGRSRLPAGAAAPSRPVNRPLTRSPRPAAWRSSECSAAGATGPLHTAPAPSVSRPRRSTRRGPSPAPSAQSRRPAPAARGSVAPVSSAGSAAQRSGGSPDPAYSSSTGYSTQWAAGALRPIGGALRPGGAGGSSGTVGSPDAGPRPIGRPRSLGPARVSAPSRPNLGAKQEEAAPRSAAARTATATTGSPGARPLDPRVVQLAGTWPPRGRRRAHRRDGRPTAQHRRGPAHRATAVGQRGSWSTDARTPRPRSGRPRNSA